eukprot:scaffold109711_cov78-Phaeocystis_antarctica.AAC.1
MAILVVPRREAVLRLALAATGRTGCRRYAQARGYRGKRLKRARSPQNRAPSHLGAAWRQNGHSGCTTPRGGSAASARCHRSHRLQARRTGAGYRGERLRRARRAQKRARRRITAAACRGMPFARLSAREAVLRPALAAMRPCGLTSSLPFARAAGDLHRRGDTGGGA